MYTCRQIIIYFPTLRICHYQLLVNVYIIYTLRIVKQGTLLNKILCRWFLELLQNEWRDIEIK